MSNEPKGRTPIAEADHGRGVDISAVDAVTVSLANEAALALARWLSNLPEPLRFDEMGTPFPRLHITGVWSDQAHADHIHVGFSR